MIWRENMIITGGRKEATPLHSSGGELVLVR